MKTMITLVILATGLSAIAVNSQDVPEAETMTVNCNCDSDKCKPVEPEKPVRGLW